MDDAIRRKILALLDGHRDMSLATVRPDGWPQATTVGYANDGLTLYFLCGPESQKAANLDDRVSLAIDDAVAQVMQIKGLSMAAHASRVVDETKDHMFGEDLRGQAVTQIHAAPVLGVPVDVVDALQEVGQPADTALG